MRKTCRLLATIVVAITLQIAAVGLASAATILVTNTNDSGAGSLRSAIFGASSGDVIMFSVSGTILLSSTLPTIATNLTIDGGSNITINGNNNVTDFSIASGFVVTLEGLTITAGKAPSNGGGILDNGAMLTIVNSFLANNSANQGGGIYVNGGTLMVLDSTFAGNTATQGGAIYNNGGIVTLTNNTFKDSSDDVFNNGGTVTVTPLPAALPLFATGLAGLVLFGRRRKKKAAALAA